MKYFPLYILLLFLLFVPPLYSQDSYSEFERGLNLTDAQKMRMGEIKNKYINEWHSLKRESIRKRLELKELSRSPSNNSEKIGRLQNEIETIERSRENLYNQYSGEVSRTLNNNQKERYNSFCDTERQKINRPFRQRRYGR
jgi:Spy/CpxP family protein refolding chaperone